VIVPADPDGSVLIRRVEGRDTPRMPLDGPPWLEPAEIAMLRDWIIAGAPAGTGADIVVLDRPARPGPDEPVHYSHIEPILLKRCIKCHSDNSKLGGPPEGLRLDSLASVLAGGERLAVLPGNPEMSEMWRRVAGFGRPRMPFDGPPWLADDDIDLIRRWIEGGAVDDRGAPAPVPAGARIRLRGILTAADAIDGARFVIGSGTRIDKSPRVGAQAELRAVVASDGRVMAERLRAR